MIVAFIDEHRERVVEGRRLGVEPIVATLRSAGEWSPAEWCTDPVSVSL